jgi:cellobiose-specific phosphotransferase system component IIC
MPPPPPTDEPVVRPKAVDSAFQAVLASVAISAVGTVVTVLLDRTQLTRYVTDMLADLPREQRVDANTMVGAFQVILAFSIAIFAGLFALFAIKMRAGRNWARVLLTVYTVYGVMTFLTAMASTGAELGLMWSLAEVAFGVTAVVYMFRPESTKYFAETKQRRLRARQRP